MKNTLKMLAIVLVLAMAVGFIGCKGKVVIPDPYSIDIASLGSIAGNSGQIGPQGGFMNTEPLPNQWADFAIYLPPFPETIQWLSFGKPPTYDRIRVRVAYYWDDMEEQDYKNSMVMVSLINDPEGDWRGPPEGPGPNTPLKAFNLTKGPEPGVPEDELPFGSRSTAGGISSPRGTSCMLTQAPSIILFQNANPDVEWIEVLEITLLKGEEEEEKEED